MKTCFVRISTEGHASMNMGCVAMITHLVLVGGFLGAGKTTLLLAAAEHLRKRGLKVALIANDQGGELVDSHMAAAAGFDGEEITGGCFCCRFSALMSSAERLLAHMPDVIFAEPVGSCMDISATILQAVKKLFSDKFRLAPYTVLVDPARAQELLAQDADPDLAYLFRNQLLEADLVILTKADRFAATAAPVILPVAPAAAISALTGEGVSEWLGRVLGGELTSGGKLIDVDYGRYAEAEASLGWLNWRFRLHLDSPVPGRAVVDGFLEALTAQMAGTDAAIMHLKIFDQTAGGWVHASVCRNGEDPVMLEGETNSRTPSSDLHELVVNFRAHTSADLLAQSVEAAAKSLGGRLTVLHQQAFHPPPPKPEHRFTKLFPAKHVN
jgi:hypothetical protein